MPGERAESAVFWRGYREAADPTTQQRVEVGLSDGADPIPAHIETDEGRGIGPPVRRGRGGRNSDRSMDSGSITPRTEQANRTSSWAFYERHFARARLQHYLVRTGGDEIAAMELYRWNTAIPGAFWQSLAYFEVAFRNALDARLSERHTLLGRSGHWAFDDVHELGRDASGPGKHRQPCKYTAESINRVKRNRKPLRDSSTNAVRFPACSSGRSKSKHRVRAPYLVSVGVGWCQRAAPTSPG